MGMFDQENEPVFQKRQWFVTTSWSNLEATQQGDTSQALAALENLCNTYWYPLYVYIRRKGNSAQDAEDLTQAFFYQVLEKNYLGAVDRRKGKFRSFLLASLNHFLSNQRDFRNAEKRGGGKATLSLDEQDAEGRYKLEPATDLTPEKIFEYRWAATLLDQVRQKLGVECEAAGKVAFFQEVQAYLMSDPPSGGYHPVADKLGMSAGAVAVAVHRLRQRFGELVKEEVKGTVASPEDVDSEMSHLLQVFREMRI
jgi:RNA polymerase sigma-70 factor (ECF subfamily)